MESFDDVKRWFPAILNLGGCDYLEMVQGREFDSGKEGDWIDYQDYTKLLEAYKELEFRMEGLEK